MTTIRPIVLAALVAAAAGPALASDLVLTKSEATTLTESNIGKPYWNLQAQCAGSFGASYAYQMQRGKARAAEKEKVLGVAMLEDAIARLQADRGLDRAAAMNLTLADVEFGRERGRTALDKEGAGLISSWNWLRSACLDIATAYHNRVRR